MPTEKLFFPTPKACTALGLKRFPAKYGNGDPGTTRKDSKDIGVQYQRFGMTSQAKSLQSLEVKSQFNPRDIKIEVLTNRPYTIKTIKGPNGGLVSEYNYGDNTIEPEYEIHISPTTEGGFELDINHEHTWGAAGSIFDKILKGAAELVGNVDDFITKVGNISKGVQGKSNSDSYKATPNRRIDVAETYVDTAKQSIVIPFVLFTPGGEENFISDIYGPIMTLTRISYPKRANSLGDADRWLSEKMGIKKEGPAGATGTGANGQATSKQDDAQMLDAINAINPGFRVFVSDPPSYVNVSHNGGLFKYNNCYITKFSYKYKHWVDGDVDSQVSPIKNAIGSGQTITDAQLKNAKFAYPLVAECSLEIKTTEPLFADDFVALSEQYGKNRKNQ